MFFKAMRNTEFYPSPNGLSVIFAISEQESGNEWNPLLGNHKKKEIRQEFKEKLDQLDSGFSGFFSRFLLSEQLKQEKKIIEVRLAKITDPHNKNIREHDFHLWTNEIHRFLLKIISNNKNLIKLGTLFLDINAMANVVEHEPQTFGLWQLNVNHLKYQFEQRKDLFKRFRQLYFKQEGKWHIDRNRLVASLSGIPHAALSKQKTLEMIILSVLLPRYVNHLKGSQEDLLFFIGENLGGELSTYRAAIQQELNNQLNANLNRDGDLTYFHPYSLKIDWSQTSNTQKQLKIFIRKNGISPPAHAESLVRELCKADSWEALSQSKLYQVLMREKIGDRMFPTIQSILYRQSPEKYALKVMKRADISPLFYNQPNTF